MMTRGALAALAAYVGLLAAARLAQAGTISFAGSGSSGTIALPSGSVPWSVQLDTVNPPQSSWGIPGLMKGLVSWPAGNGSLTGFDVTFTGLPSGVSINPSPAPTSPFGSDNSTRFSDTTQGFLFDRSLSGNSVTFTAPAGKSVSPGDNLFVNVVFTGNAGPVTFSGHLTTTDTIAATPEPAALTLVGSGALGLLACAWKRRKCRCSWTRTSASTCR
jgi:hypothetical protein